MADPEPRGQEARPQEQARTARATGRETARSAEIAENRVFDQGADVARRAAEAGTETARDIARAGAESGRRLAETGSRVLGRSADLWRQSMFPLTSFSYEMNRLFDEFWRTTGMASASLAPMSAPGAGLMQGLMGLPTADLHETNDAYHIVVELAGMGPREIEIFIDGDALVVRGDKRDSHHEEQPGFRVNERRFGHFERRFHLPRDVDRESIQADFHQGLLEIRVGRHAHAEETRKRIEIRDGGEQRGEVGGRPGQGRGQARA